jgi:hypothetical protein
MPQALHAAPSHSLCIIRRSPPPHHPDPNTPVTEADPSGRGNARAPGLTASALLTTADAPGQPTPFVTRGRSYPLHLTDFRPLTPVTATLVSANGTRLPLGLITPDGDGQVITWEFRVGEKTPLGDWFIEARQQLPPGETPTYAYAPSFEVRLRRGRS